MAVLEAVKVQYQANALESELGEGHLVASLLKLPLASVLTIVFHGFVTPHFAE